MKCRFMLSKKENAAYNMALDEALFISSKNSKTPFSSFRIYSWKKPCHTIGYFQKYAETEQTQKLPVIRRLTGGLTVLHKSDISYSLITNASDWPYVYEQEKSYKALHSAIKNALVKLGIKAEFIKAVSGNAKNNVCVQTLFDYDLEFKCKKIVGSCQRRSGKILLQQGSIHFNKGINFEKAAAELKKALLNELNMDFNDSAPTKKEEFTARMLIKTKYSNQLWNKKF